MSYAPATLLQARAYVKAQTGLGDGALGIVGDSAHRYGYHLGRDRLPASDYSRTTARDLAGLSDAASALDVGNFGGLRALTAFMVGEARAGRLGDVRELIGPGSDGRAYRWEHLGGWAAVRRAAGDSHEWHLHISYYRDSEQRSKLPPFQRFFEGTEGDDVELSDKVNLWDEAGNKPWRAGRTIGVTKDDPDVSVAQLLQWGGEVGHLVHERVLPALVRGEAQQAALAGQLAGLTVLVQQLLTAPPVDLTPEQLAELTAAVTQAAAAGAERALEDTRLVVGEA